MTPHEQLGELAGLIGTWSGDGTGDYPTIDPFAYRETVTFGHVGKPFLTYVQKTRDATTDQPLHTETGYVRAVGDGRVELVIAQPTGLAETLAGTLADGVIDVADGDVGRTPTAKEVTRSRRRFVLAGDTLSYDMWMAFAHVPETHHLHAELHRDHDA